MADARRRVRRAVPATQQEQKKWLTHNRRSEAPSQTANTLAAAALLAVLLAGIVAFSSLGPFDFGSPAGANPVSPAVIESGRQWELQRRQQSGYVDPLTPALIESGRQWELQRRQQSGDGN